MITLRRANERLHDRNRNREVWLTFYPQDRAGSLAGGFGALELFDEVRLSPGAGAPRRADHDTETVTFVREGAIAYEDSTGRSGVVYAGEFQRMTTKRGVRYREANASRIGCAHLFRIRLRPAQAELEACLEQRRWSAAERRGSLRIVASPDARKGSLLVHQDALLYSALLEPGQHVAHELSPGRCAWLHLVQGEVTLGDVVLTTGDAAGVTAERAVSLTPQEDTEILLIDLGDRRPTSSENGFSRKRPTISRMDRKAQE